MQLVFIEEQQEPFTTDEVIAEHSENKIQSAENSAQYKKSLGLRLRQTSTAMKLKGW